MGSPFHFISFHGHETAAPFHFMCFTAFHECFMKPWVFHETFIWCSLLNITVIVGQKSCGNDGKLWDKNWKIQKLTARRWRGLAPPPQAKVEHVKYSSRRNFHWNLCKSMFSHPKSRYEMIWNDMKSELVSFHAFHGLLHFISFHEMKWPWIGVSPWVFHMNSKLCVCVID